MDKTMSNFINGKYGKLTVKEDLGIFIKDGTSRKEHYVLCQCDCGRLSTVSITSIKTGNTKTCGHCTSSGGNLKYGKKIYNAYIDMRRRCYDDRLKTYKHYGGRGITVCQEWLDPNNGFENFCKWSLKNGFAENLSLDRIDNDKGYSPNNCRWTTRRIQNINKRPNQKNSSGFIGIKKHSNGKGWYGSVKVDNKDFFTGYSRDIIKAVKMRNDYIIQHNLDNKLNEVV